MSQDQELLVSASNPDPGEPPEWDAPRIQSLDEYGGAPGPEWLSHQVDDAYTSNVLPFAAGGDPLAALIERTALDPAAAFAPAVLTALARLKGSSPGEFECLLGRLKGAKVAITALRKEVSKATQHVRREARIATGGDWMADLIVNGDGQPMAVLANAMHALRKAPDLHALISYDEFALSMILRRRPPWEADVGSWSERPWRDSDDKLFAEWLQRSGIMVDDRTAGKAADVVSSENGFHPVRDYLRELKWDARGRVDQWLSDYLGAPDTPYAQAVGRRWLIAAVARIFQPGAKVDNVMILEGDQGAGKSSALAILGGRWFTDRVSDLASKDAAQELAGVWIIEFGELGSLRGAHVNDAKAFLSRTEDRYRPPYGKHVIKAPRQCVFASSVNPMGGYLKDATGGRRFWPVKCGQIHCANLEQDRDQLWAEAVHLYHEGHKWWLETSELQGLAAVEAGQRQEEDPWKGLIQNIVLCKNSVKVPEVLTALDIDKRHWDRLAEMRVSKILKGLGFTREREGAGDRDYYYERRLEAVEVDDEIEF